MGKLPAPMKKKQHKEFIEAFKKLILDEGYIPQQVFNCDETGFFWKKMPPSYIHHRRRKRNFLDTKPLKDRLTLALCANASGDLKIKTPTGIPLKNPCASRYIMCRRISSPSFGGPTPKLGSRGFYLLSGLIAAFGPAVKKYLEENGLPLKCLLVLDNAPAHPPGLERTDTSRLRLHQSALSATEHHFHPPAYGPAKKAWGEVSRCTLNSAWRKLWTAVVAERDFEGFEIPTEEAVDDPAPLEEIISLSKSLGLVVDEADIDNLLDEHKEELNTDDLKALEAMEISDLQEEHHSSVEEEVEVALTSRNTGSHRFDQGFLLGLRRLIARRRRPSIIYSDELKYHRDRSCTNKIHWNCSPPPASWLGGFWKRLVQMIKEAFALSPRSVVSEL
ncbi:tigger transposable element-derived protein 1-like [Stegodyphus dumicola]|uniref:tigger transposable element-derived protein 1-like n=1 Tax=Stegodyphus dumicola TaxID=202533 RepID=UPI0015AF19A0|nr:tigger transposable element-derived protein 1-like [Stegodyphus dumicola]